MKTKVNQMMFAAVFALFMIGGNVYATGKEAIVVSGLEIMMDAELELENWMIENTYWVNVENVQEMDQTLLLEPWMIDQKKWNLPEYGEVRVEADDQLKLEEWMTSNIFWN